MGMLRVSANRMKSATHSPRRMQRVGKFLASSKTTFLRQLVSDAPYSHGFAQPTLLIHSRPVAAA
jgi:hypothetical protein